MSETIKNAENEGEGKGGPASLELVRQPRREPKVVESEVALFDTGMFEHMQRVAKAMAMASVMPDHLRAKPYFVPKNGLAPAEAKALRQELGEAEWTRAWREAEQRTEANCFLVVNQAQSWRMNPFAVANASYVVGGKLAFEGKLVGGVVNSLGRLKKKLSYEFDGEGPERRVVVHGTREGENEDRVVEVVVKDVRTDNKMWNVDPDQKLVYNGNLKWARRWIPELLLGLVFDEDIERLEHEKNVTPKDSGVAGLEAKLAQPRAETGVTAASHVVVQEEPAEAPCTLTVAHQEEIRATAGRPPVIPIEALEGKLGEYLAEVSTREGQTETQLYAEILEVLGKLKVEATAKTTEAPASGSLFDPAPPSSGKSGKK